MATILLRTSVPRLAIGTIFITNSPLTYTEADSYINPFEVEALITSEVSLECDISISAIDVLDAAITLSESLIADFNLNAVSGFDVEVLIVSELSTDTASVVVLNLRTKAHCLYDPTTENAYATTGELMFDSFKNKNVSDAFVFGRSGSVLSLTTWNNEETQRTYEITYADGTQGVLKNKKKALAKGLTGTNWKFMVSKAGDSSVEVRSIDLIVNELQRHV